MDVNKDEFQEDQKGNLDSCNIDSSNYKSITQEDGSHVVEGNEEHENNEEQLNKTDEGGIVEDNVNNSGINRSVDVKMPHKPSKDGFGQEKMIIHV